MGCLKLKYLENPSPLKVVYRANEAEQKPAQGFWSIDPLAGNAPGWTPYNAFWNNPILNIDPDGACAVGGEAGRRFNKYKYHTINSI
jgi:hypothetical protein